MLPSTSTTPTTPTTSKRPLHSPESEDKQIEKKPKESETMEVFAKKIDLVLLKLQSLDEGQTTIREDLLWLKNTYAVLHEKFDNANAEINVLKQRLQVNSFVMFGLPPTTEKGPVFPLVLNYVKSLGYNDLKEEDLRTVYATNMKDGSGCRIGGTFYDLRQRDRIFNLIRAKWLKKEHIFVETVLPNIDLAHEFRGKKVNMMQALTPETIVVLNEARKHKGAAFEFVWVKDGIIRVKQKKDARTYEISSVKQLKQIVFQLAQTPSTNNEMN